jgi:hypothetical protein
MINQPKDPNPMYLFNSTENSSPEVGQIGERPNKDTVKSDTTNREKRDTVKRQPPTIFGDLLVKLNLTTEQKSVVNNLLKEYNSCRENCVRAQRDAERQILITARSKEEAIKKELQEGKITKSQARERLANLKKETNELLKNLPIRTKIQECLKTCDNSFINSLERILNENQKTILKKWLESRNKRGNAGDKKDTVTVGKRG